MGEGNRNTWDRVEQPTLEWIADHTGARALVPSEVAEEIGAEAHEVNLAVERLMAAGYVGGMPVWGGEAGTVMHPELVERGLRAADVWPSEDPYADLIRRLDAAIAQSSLAEDRTKLERVRDGMLDAGRDLSLSVLSGFVQSRLGL